MKLYVYFLMSVFFVIFCVPRKENRLNIAFSFLTYLPLFLYILNGVD